MTVLEIARAYLGAGLNVIPIIPDGTKRPALPKGHPVINHERLATDAELASWFEGGRKGVGIKGGVLSGGLEVLDFEDLAAYLAWLELVEAEFPGLAARLPLVGTPGGGRHLYYRCAEIAGNQKLARREDGETLIETRGEGGYVLAPGCPPECHEARAPYHRVAGPKLTEVPNLEDLWDGAAAARQAMLDAARCLNRHAEPAVAFDRAPAAGGRPGDDFNARAAWEDVLAPHGWEAVQDRGGVTRWRRPGKAGNCWSATTGHCKGTDGRDLLWVFSSSAAPFEPEKSYSRFAAHALLNHGGDFRAAASDLGRKGYGEQRQRPARPSANGGPRHQSPGNGDAAEPEEDRAAWKATLPEEEPDIPLPSPEPWPDPPAEEAYHGLAGEVVRLIAPQTEADPAAILVQILVMFGNAIGRKAFWPVEADRHYGNLFAVLVGDTATGRKGVSKGRALSAFTAVPGWSPQCLATGLSSGEGLIWAVRDPVHKLHHVKQRGRVVDTQQVMEDAGVADKRLLVIEPEFASPLKVMQRDGNTLSARIREAWDDGNLRSMTKNSQARATGAHISILAHVTRSELHHSTDQVSGVNGLYNRFLWAAVRRSKALPLGGSPVDMAGVTGRVADAVEYASGRDLVWLTEAASRLWCGGLYDRLTSLAGGVLNRAASQVRRLAMLYALLDFKPDVDECHLRAASALWGYCERSVRWVFGCAPAQGDPFAVELLTLLRSAGGDGMSQTGIHDYFGRHVRGVKLGEALASLEAAGVARSEQVQTKGRPSRRWFARDAEQNVKDAPCEKSEECEESNGVST